MSKNLTKNARWIVVWMLFKNNYSYSLPQELVMNLGRHPYDVAIEQAFSELVDMHDDILLAYKTYLVDVQLFPYSKQHTEVTRIATAWFKQHGATI